MNKNVYKSNLSLCTTYNIGSKYWYPLRSNVYYDANDYSKIK